MQSVLNWLAEQGLANADWFMDSRELQAGGVFIACAGESSHGADYVPAAVQAGAAAVLCDKALPAVGVPFLCVPDLKLKLGALLQQRYGQALSALRIVAVTGTNGKTSCVHYIAQALHELGMASASMGTLGVRLGNGQSVQGAGLTTPNCVAVHRQLAQLQALGVQAVALEASSIGLVQGRLDGVPIQVAAFSNLTQDHLDYHGDMVQYADCKRLLFLRPEVQVAVGNAQDANTAYLLQDCQAPQRIDYAIDAKATLSARDLQFQHHGVQFTLHYHQQSAVVSLGLLGRHNVENALLVAAVLLSMHYPLPAVAQALSKLHAVPGRLTPLPAMPQQPMVVVDYAHTPDALAKALAALRPTAQARGGRLHLVFGCGGNRDRSKRPLMGAVAQQGADVVYVSSDNPRHEAPDAILQDIVADMSPLPTVESDRGVAIVQSVLMANPDDVILIAGKGHEDYQERQGQKTVFDDAQWAALALHLRRGARVQTDSRQVQAGDIFVALLGEQFDGHAFIDAARQAGAAFVVYQSDWPPVSTGQAGATLATPDTVQALAQMATAWRRQWQLPVVAVTGSNGKTTCKNMLASIAQAHWGQEAVYATPGNWNNHIGLPLCVLSLRAQHQVAILELGMNHPGEIAHLAAIAQPTVALITNAQREHQAFLKTVQAVAQENGQVIHYLPTDAPVVFPAQDAFASLWADYAQARPQWCFGEQGRVWATSCRVLPQGSTFTLQYQPDNADTQSVTVTLSIQGQHHVHNAVASATVALALGVPLATVAQGLQAFSPAPGRMQCHLLPQGAQIIDDSYNANPDSVRAAIDALSQWSGSKWLVLGDMAEVGESALSAHQEVQAYALARGITQVLTLGDWHRAAQQAGVQAFDDIDSLLATLRLQWPQAQAQCLVKGSRAARMERVVQALLAWSTPSPAPVNE